MSTLTTHIPRTLIADDQPHVLAALRLLLKGAGYQTEAADSPKAVLEAIKKREFDVVPVKDPDGLVLFNSSSNKQFTPGSHNGTNRIASKQVDRMGTNEFTGPIKSLDRKEPWTH